MADRVMEKTVITAPALAVWELVSDVSRMGEWSPETTSCAWEKGSAGAQVGARFSGRNRNGRYRWSTSCTVTAADPGRLFTFEVSSFGLRVAEWSYALAPDGDGCVLTEHVLDQRGRAMRLIGRVGTGVSDRMSHNREGMVRTLAAIKQTAESSAVAG
jgi:ligand-binding SRPBCC domain-containing protein